MSNQFENEILEERQKVYGDPVEMHERIASVWSAIINKHITAHEVALMMVGLKLCRSQNSPEHTDSITDMLGYSEIAKLIVDRQEGPSENTVSHDLGDDPSLEAQLVSVGLHRNEAIVWRKVVNKICLDLHLPFIEIANVFLQVAASRRLTVDKYVSLREKGLDINTVLAERLNVPSDKVLPIVSGGYVHYEIFFEAVQRLLEPNYPLPEELKQFIQEEEEL